MVASPDSGPGRHSINWSPEPFDIRKVWVRREDFIELKIWFIFGWHVVGSARNSLSEFCRAEQSRADQVSPDPAVLRRVAHQYTWVDNCGPEIPPRLITIPAQELEEMGTRLVKRKVAVYGDSVGGISPSQEGNSGDEIASDVLPQTDVLFSPGVLSRLWLTEDGEGPSEYVFQLAAKNLRRTGAIFYKPVGGHLKYRSSFSSVTKKLGLRLKEADQKQDGGDLAVSVKGKHLDELLEIFLKETCGDSEQHYFTRPIDSMYDELREELGPVPTSDGISLLTDEEILNDLIRSGHHHH